MIRFLFFSLSLLTACGSSASPVNKAAAQAPQLPVIALPPALDRVLRDYEQGWRARDARRLSSLFVEDGFVLSMGRPPVRGRAAIERAYSGAGGDLTLAALAYSTGDSVGYIIGTFGGGDPSSHTGKFVLALRLSPTGKWMIAADMDNSSR